MLQPFSPLIPAMLRAAILTTGLIALLFLSGGAGHAAHRPEVRAVRVGAHTDMTRVVLDVSERIPFLAIPISNWNVLVIKLPKVAWGTRASRRLNTGLVKGYRHDVVGGGSVITFSLKTPVSVKRSFSMVPDGDGGHRIVIDLVLTQGVAATSAAGFSHKHAGSKELVVEPVERSTGLKTVIGKSARTAAGSASIRFDHIVQVNKPASFQQWLQQEQYNPNLYRAREWYRRTQTPPKPYTSQQLKIDLRKAREAFLRTQASPKPYRSQQPIPSRSQQPFPARSQQPFPARSQQPIPARMVTQQDPVERVRQTVLGHSNEPDAGLGRFYVGGHLGYGLAAYDALYTDGTDTVEVDGISGEGLNMGPHVGLGVTFDRIYVGVETEYDYGNIETSARVNSTTVDLTRDHSFMLSGRLGYHLAAGTLGYLRLGAAHSRWHTETSVGFDETDWLTGVAFGLGADYSPGSSYSVRGEILGINYEEYDKTVGSERITVDPSVYSLRVGLDYQF